VQNTKEIQQVINIQGFIPVAIIDPIESACFLLATIQNDLQSINSFIDKNKQAEEIKRLSNLNQQASNLLTQAKLYRKGDLAENQRLRDLLFQKTQENEHLNQIILQLKEENDKVNGRVQTLESEMKTLEGEMKTRECEIHTLKSDITTLTCEITSLKEENNEKKRKYALGDFGSMFGRVLGGFLFKKANYEVKLGNFEKTEKAFTKNYTQDELKKYELTKKDIGLNDDEGFLEILDAVAAMKEPRFELAHENIAKQSGPPRQQLDVISQELGIHSEFKVLDDLLKKMMVSGKIFEPESWHINYKRWE